MACTSCASGRQREFVAEINIHFPGLKNLGKPSVFAFPTVLVCLDCGFSQFLVTDPELTLLAEGVRTSQPSLTNETVSPSRFQSQDCA